MENKKYTPQDLDTKAKRDRRLIDANRELENGTMTEDEFLSIAKDNDAADRKDKDARIAELQHKDFKGTILGWEKSELETLEAELDNKTDEEAE